MTVTVALGCPGAMTMAAAASTLTEVPERATDPAANAVPPVPEPPSHTGCRAFRSCRVTVKQLIHGTPGGLDNVDAGDNRERNHTP